MAGSGREQPRLDAATVREVARLLEERLKVVQVYGAGGCPTCHDGEARAFAAQLRRLAESGSPSHSTPVSHSLSELALDSNCLSYVIEALEGVAEPTDELAEQKVALVRLYLYTPGTLWTLPKVKEEFSRITDPVRRARHESWTNVLFGVRPLNRPEAVKRRAADLERLHADHDDRMVLAEAEDIGFSALLTFDTRFVKRLAAHTRLNLTTPATFWQTLGVPKGASPHHLPSHGNPLADETWWRWQ
jgi:hypothetical protein